VKEWLNSCQPFCGVLKSPCSPLGPKELFCACKGSNYTAVLTQWFSLHFWFAILISPGIFVTVLTALVFDGQLQLQNLIIGICNAFLISWVGWYALVARHPTCFCCIIVLLESPWVGLLWGLYVIWFAVYLIQASLASLGAGMDGLIPFICYLVYGIVALCTGHAAARIGCEASGIHVPEIDASGVGKPTGIHLPGRQ
jgi:hypothetical protein